MHPLAYLQSLGFSPQQPRPNAAEMSLEKLLGQQQPEFLSPELIQELAMAGQIPERQRMLEQQMAQAQALGQGAGPMHNTPLGALFGAASETLDAYTTKKEQDKARAEMRALMDRLDRTSADFAQTRYGDWRQQQNSPPDPLMYLRR